MGKATIISEIGNGKYKIQPIIDTTWASNRITVLTEKNTELTSEISSLESELATAASVLESVMQSINEAIINGEKTSVEESEYKKAFVAYNDMKYRLNDRKLQKSSNSTEISRLYNAISTPSQVDAWCTDFTEDGSGTVGTIEVGRENTVPIIVPGCAAYSSASDGLLQPLQSTTPSAVFYNLAMLPGAAKWKPRYRTGIASNVNTTNDTMTVSLDEARVSWWDCNQASVLSGVTVEYMGCNAEAFNNGDAVVVKFEGMNWSSPKVIGFVESPVECNPELTLSGSDVAAVDNIYVASGGKPPYTFSVSGGSFWSAEGSTTCIITDLPGDCGEPLSPAIMTITVTDDSYPQQEAHIDARLPGGVWRLAAVVKGCPVDEQDGGTEMWQPIIGGFRTCYVFHLDQIAAGYGECCLALNTSASMRALEPAITYCGGYSCDYVYPMISYVREELWGWVCPEY